MKKLIIVLFVALFVFTGCKEEEPVYYDCDVTVSFLKTDGNYLWVNDYEYAYLYVTSPDGNTTYLDIPVSENPIKITLRNNRNYLFTFECENEYYYRWAEKYVELKENYSIYNLMITTKVEYIGDY